ncbi:ATP-dependent DNA ligase [Streptacidiphilus sp. PB12-B1b]|uniref:non-homologous end-joining DNA ligase n=1 Tax=Streptacidiphilus sp. PB12-B1b TaxID=2705012 RepID=UPI0015FCF21E|nr:non-homologous end-joining DNA ligase [Streptacidiphilus sp. PB12-B1b]QMU77414.1 ATP-dependent DNA ligase [Streptacidiphilus sp. PB12-B1b]
MAEDRTVVEIDGRRVSLSHLGRLLYPGSGTTKAGVLHYYTQVAPALLPHLADRPASFLRCPDGVDGERFWAKNIPLGAPDWIPTLDVVHHAGSTRQIVLADLATLMWSANLSNLEIHVPQWRIAPELHDRLVVDLDPGEGTTMLHCCAAALAVRQALERDGLRAWPKTSGSKGLHLGVPLRPTAAGRVSRYAERLARRLATDLPELIVSRMAVEARRGRVFLDWSQNASAKTTVAPYSLRARSVPTVSAPVTWAEVADCRDPAGLVFTADQVAERLARDGDLWAQLTDPEAAQELPAG